MEENPSGMVMADSADGQSTVYVAPSTLGIMAVTFDQQKAEEHYLTFREYKITDTSRDANMLENAEFTGEEL